MVRHAARRCRICQNARHGISQTIGHPIRMLPGAMACVHIWPYTYGRSYHVLVVGLPVDLAPCVVGTLAVADTTELILKRS